jgi:hypothetical protein
MRLPGLLGGTKTEELRPGGGWPLAYGISPCETCELRLGGGRDMLTAVEPGLREYRIDFKLDRRCHASARTQI